MKLFKKMYNWLFIDAIIVILVGCYISFFSSTPFFVFNNFINHYFWPNGLIPDNGSEKIIQFIYSLVGVVMIIWGILLIFILRNGFKVKAKWAWQSIFYSIIIWFPIDEFFSIYYGVYFNVFFNLVFLAIFIIPLVISRKYFFKLKVKE